jgi:dipeptidyl aminopeptidase/acylaminoacyl peptidase
VPATIGDPPANLHAQSVTFPSESGSLIHGWFARGQAQAGAVLLLPGVRANRLSMLEPARFLHAEGYSLLLIDFQATGESAGDAITFGWRERLDVIAAINALKKFSPGERIGIVGRSLGGAATALAAGELDVHAVVLEAVYPSIEAAVDNRLRIRLGEAGTWLAPLLLMQLSPRLGVNAADLRPAASISRLHCPVLIIAGENDRHTTAADTRQLFDAAQEPKELWLIPAADHNNYPRVAGATYAKRLLEFFGRTLRSV